MMTISRKLPEATALGTAEKGGDDCASSQVSNTHWKRRTWRIKKDECVERIQKFYEQRRNLCVVLKGVGDEEMWTTLRRGSLLTRVCDICVSNLADARAFWKVLVLKLMCGGRSQEVVGWKKMKKRLLTRGEVALRPVRMIVLTKNRLPAPAWQRFYFPIWDFRH
jgi:hypothetical protein